MTWKVERNMKFSSKIASQKDISKVNETLYTKMREFLKTGKLLKEITSLYLTPKLKQFILISRQAEEKFIIEIKITIKVILPLIKGSLNKQTLCPQGIGKLQYS